MVYIAPDYITVHGFSPGSEIFVFEIGTNFSFIAPSSEGYIRTCTIGPGKKLDQAPDYTSTSTVVNCKKPHAHWKIACHIDNKNFMTITATS